MVACWGIFAGASAWASLPSIAAEDSATIDECEITLVELNCENLFDYTHDEGKQDEEYLPEAVRRWTRGRYWKKLGNIGRAIISCGDPPADTLSSREAAAGWKLPDLVALCEVENDSVVRDLTRRSLLRNAGYQYLVTQSPDVRGIDVALLYSPFTFRLISHQSLRVTPVKDMRPTRDILYASGEIISGDTLHIFVVHAPSRYGGERFTRPHRRAVMDRLMLAVDSLRAATPDPLIVVTGDLNESHNGHNIRYLASQDLHPLRPDMPVHSSVAGTYKYKGVWESIDHIIVSPALLSRVRCSHVHAPAFLLEHDDAYGGIKPFRTYFGMQHRNGFSDHLPLVSRFLFPIKQEPSHQNPSPQQ